MSPLRRLASPLITAGYRSLWRVSRGMTLGVRGLALDAAGAVMLVRHTYRPGWYLPGGGVEHGETAETAIAREMQEEAGIEPRGRPRLFGLYSNARHYANDHVALYLIEGWDACAPSADHEIAERGFFALDALPDGVTPATQRRLAEALNGADRDPLW